MSFTLSLKNQVRPSVISKIIFKATGVSYIYVSANLLSSFMTEKSGFFVWEKIQCVIAVEKKQTEKCLTRVGFINSNQKIDEMEALEPIQSPSSPSTDCIFLHKIKI